MNTSSKTVGGITFRKSGAVIVDKAALNKSVVSYEKQGKLYAGVDAKLEEHLGDVAIWGAMNDLPYQIARDMELCGMLNGGIDTKARITIGKGPMPAIVRGITKDGQEELEFIDDPEIADFLEANNDYFFHYASVKDLVSTGNMSSQMILSRDRKKITNFKRNDISECRLSKMNPATRRSEKIYLSSDWRQYTQINEKSSYVAELPLLDKEFPLLDLQSRTKGFGFAVWNNYPLFGRKYYPLPLWWPAYKWVQIAKGIPEMKEAMFKNQMTIKYQVIIHELFWEKQFPGFSKNAEKQNEIREAFFDQVDEYLVGGKNAYKSMFSNRWLAPDGNPVNGIEIIAIDDKIKDGKLLPDSAAANSEIAFALQVNPALFGANMPGGAYQSSGGGGSNIREAYLVQVMLMEAERKIGGSILNLVKQYNGWHKGERLVFRYPNQILTTLDKGKNTEGVV